MWLYENDNYAIKNQKIKAFENHNFEFDFVSQKEFDSFSGTQKVELSKNEEYLSDEELYDKLMKYLPSGAIYDSERKNKDVYAAQESGIYSTSPLSAKVGSKENVYRGERFFVYERIQTKSGSTKESYVGAIRAKSSNYNEDAETGNSGTTRFRKFMALKLFSQACLSKKKLDRDFSITLSKNLLNLPTYYQENEKELKLEDNSGNVIKWTELSDSFLKARISFGVKVSF
ncbi:MAG: hypothetical protein IPO23_13375 [Flavobacterium sp.]|nr:hypothetical protein [Flavobacterium sp.]